MRERLDGCFVEVVEAISGEGGQGVSGDHEQDHKQKKWAGTCLARPFMFGPVCPFVIQIGTPIRVFELVAEPGPPVGHKYQLAAASVNVDAPPDGYVGKTPLAAGSQVVTK